MKLSTAKLVVLIMSVLGVLFVGGLSAFLLLPSFTESIRLSGEILKAHAELDAQYSDRKSLLSSLKKSEGARDSIKALTVEFQTPGRELDLITAVEALAAKDGVVEHFSLSPRQAGGGMPELQEAFDLTVEGEYRDVMQMLVDVEKMPVILVTENGLIHPGQGASGESKDFVSMTLRGSVVSLPQGL